MANGPSRPSRTALHIARSYALLKDHPVWSQVAPKGSLDLAERIVDAAVSGLPSIDRFAQSAPFLRLSRMLDRRGPMQGGMLHLALRKRWIDDQVRSAIGEGFTQVVVIGAGYDSLAFRMAREFQAVKFFEVDTRSTQHEKHKALQSIGRAEGQKDLPENLELFVLDLGHGAIDRALLAQRSADSARPTLFVAEGVLMYLRESDALEVLRAAARIRTPRSRIVFSYLGAEPSGKPHAGDWGRTVTALVRLAGEPFQFAIARESLGTLLKECGLLLREEIDERGLLARYLPEGAGEQALLEWEFLACADRA